MAYKIAKIPKSRIEIKFEVPWAEFERFEKEAVLSLGRDLKIEGFRAGHIPEEMVRNAIGQAKILEEAAELAVKENYSQAAKENNFFPLGRPEIQVLKIARGNPFEFKIIVSVLPEIRLPDYRKNISGIKRIPVGVTEAEVEESLVWLQKSQAKFSQKTDGAATGDFVEIEYSSPLAENGKIFQDGFILGQGRLFGDLEKNIAGLKPGQEREITIAFPGDYKKKELAGQRGDFKIKIKTIQKIELPAINDDFARGLGNFENLGFLKESVRNGLLMEKEKARREKLRREIMEKISAAVDFEIPEVLVEREKEHYWGDFKKRIADLRLTFEEYLARAKKTEQELADAFYEKAQNAVKNSLILREISRQENISISAAELEEEISKTLRSFPDIKAAKKVFDADELKEYTEEAAINEKTFQLLESCVKQ